MSQKWIIGCEKSQQITLALRRKGIEAFSCDIEPTTGEEKFHIQDDILKVLKMDLGFTSGVFHPECTFLTSANTYISRGCSKYTAEEAVQLVEEAVQFFLSVWHLAEKRLHEFGFENPIGKMSTIFRKPDQIIQPYQFGDDASKATCLWLHNLPVLKPTTYIEPRMVNGKKRWANQTDSGQNRLAPSADRSAKRAETYLGIADAIADQWTKPYFKPTLF